MTNVNTILRSIDLKKLLIFIVSGLLFILIAKASMNIKTFLGSFYSIIITELLFLLFSYFAYIIFSKKIINSVFSFGAYFVFLGALSVLLIEYFYNNNRDFAFFVFVFLFILKGLQLSVARISIDNLIPRIVKIDFFKRILTLYLIYIFVGFSIYFAFSSINIWSFGFLVLLVLMFLSYLIFLFRLKNPKKIKHSKIAYKDVSFY